MTRILKPKLDSHAPLEPHHGPKRVPNGFSLSDFLRGKLQALHDEGRYRIFAELQRERGHYPRAKWHHEGKIDEVKVWCSNDYLGQSQSPTVLAAMHRTLDETGAGAGGTRNISGTHHYHVLLERELADWMGREAALIFTSGYVANLATLATLGSQIEDMVFFSDASNHNSMIEGMRQSRAQKIIFKHNDPDDLRAKLEQVDANRPKIIAFESVYSMDGDIAPLAELAALAREFNALTFLDEVHAVGMYGAHGAGIAERDQVDVDILQGTLAKAVGIQGGYIAGSRDMIDFIRSYGNAFIFTTSMPPACAAGALASIRELRGARGATLRARQRQHVSQTKALLTERNLPVMPSESHIVPLLIGNSSLCRRASDELLARHRIYVQPINYPTVPRTTERLRITPSPVHNMDDIDALVEALDDVWTRLSLPRANAATQVPTTPTSTNQVPATRRKPVTVSS